MDRKKKNRTNQNRTIGFTSGRVLLRVSSELTWALMSRHMFPLKCKKKKKNRALELKRAEPRLSLALYMAEALM